MKILYAIQGTGNGHLARAEDLIPILKEYGDLDLFVSGAQVDIVLPYPIKYRSRGLSFYFGKRGGIDFIKTFSKNSTIALWKETREFPVEQYDLVINDFEFISAWACRRKGVPCIALSHQSALLSPKVPKPGFFDPVGSLLLKHYAPADGHVAFHFDRYDDFIYPPIIRSEIRNVTPRDEGHITVYLPAYDDKTLVTLFSEIKGARWHIFSKHSDKSYQAGGISVFPVDKSEFAKSMVNSTAVFCGAGFETPAEALFLNKKLMVIPMKSQYEQHFNAAAAASLGVPVLKRLNRNSLDEIRNWIETDKRVTVDYPDVRRDAIEHALRLYEGIKK